MKDKKELEKNYKKWFRRFIFQLFIILVVIALRLGYKEVHWVFYIGFAIIVFSFIISIHKLLTFQKQRSNQK